MENFQVIMFSYILKTFDDLPHAEACSRRQVEGRGLDSHPETCLLRVLQFLNWLGLL